MTLVVPSYCSHSSGVLTLPPAGASPTGPRHAPAHGHEGCTALMLVGPVERPQAGAQPTGTQLLLPVRQECLRCHHQRTACMAPSQQAG
jgi:hypothetical protein